MKFKTILFLSFFSISFLGFTGCNQAQNSSAEENAASGITNLAPKAYQEALKNNPGILLDVRTPEEFAAGHLEGALNINFNSAQFKDEVMKLDKSKTVYVYCAVGGRSGNAQALMAQNDFRNVINMSGGINQWQSEGLPVVK